MKIQKIFRLTIFFYKSIEKKNHHWEEQIKFVPDNIDYVGRIENMNSCWYELKKIVGLRGDINHVNKTKNGPMKDITLSSDIIKIFEDKYNSDITMYNTILK